MAEPKTKPTTASVKAFIDAIEDEQQRKDCRSLMKMMKDVTGQRPKMWGDNIVGYGTYTYKYATGREGDWPLVGFSPRKQNLSVYIMSGFTGHAALMKKLGKHKTGKSCLYIKRLEDVDVPTLEKVVAQSVAFVQKKFPS